MKNPVFRFGLIGGAIGLLLFFLPWLIWGTSIPFQTAEFIGYLTIFISLSVVYFGIRSYRETVNGGKLTFGQGMIAGAKISLFPSVVICIYTAIFFKVYGSEFQAYAEDHYKKSMSAVEYEKFTAQMASMNEIYLNPFFQGLVMFLTVFVLGLVVAAISSAVLRRA